MKNLILFVFFVLGVSTLYVSNSYSSSVGGGGASLPSCANESYVLTYSTSSSSYSCAAASGSVTGLTAPLATDGVFRIVSNGSFELSGGGGLGKGANLYMEGQDATNANDFKLRAGTTNVMFWDDSAFTMHVGKITSNGILAIRSNDIRLGSGGSSGDWSIVRATQDDGKVFLAGGSGYQQGASLVLNGPTTASTANDFQLKVGTTNVMFWDNSANGLVLGLNTNSSTYLNGNYLQLNYNGPAASNYSITSGIATGSVQISSGTGAGDGAYLKLFGPSHASTANDFSLSTTTGDVLTWDDSAALMTFRHDTNGTNRYIFRNTDAGSSAKVQWTQSTTAGDFNITSLSTVGGGTVNLVADATFNGGMNISQLGSGGIFFKSNNATRMTIPVTGVVAINSDATINGSQAATAANALTFTNKTFDADGSGNSITNIENADIKSGAAIAQSKISQTGFVESWPMVIPVATDGTYPIHPGDSIARQVKNVKGKCGAGVATGIFKLNTTTIDSLGTFAFTTTYQTVAAGTGANNDWSADTPMVVQLTTAGTCTNLQFRVESTRD